MHTEEAIIARGVMAMEMVIGVLELQEIKFRLRSRPSNDSTLHWVIQSILSDSSLGYKRPPAIARGIILAIFLLPATGLQMALEVGVSEIRTLIIWQHINGLVYMPKTKSSLIRHQVVLHIQGAI